MQQLPPKDLGERKLLRFFFGGDLAPGETLTSATVSIELLSGADEAPAAVLDGLPVVDNAAQEVQQWVEGGVSGATYGLRCLANASGGAVHLVSARLPVRRL